MNETDTRTNEIKRIKAEAMQGIEEANALIREAEELLTDGPIEFSADYEYLHEEGTFQLKWQPASVRAEQRAMLCIGGWELRSAPLKYRLEAAACVKDFVRDYWLQARSGICHRSYT